jgi:hypothetical protein
MSPLGGVPILWNEASPAEADIADAAPIRSIETSIRNGLDSEHNWPASGGANVGYHRLGSARVFYDVESNVSSSGTDGRILVTSDTSRLFHVGSAGTMFLGGQNTLSVGSSPVGGQKFYWAEEFGSLVEGAVPVNSVTFPNSGFSGVPFTQLSVFSSGPVHLVLTNLSPTLVGYQAYDKNGVGVGKFTVFWRSVGTRVL